MNINKKLDLAIKEKLINNDKITLVYFYNRYTFKNIIKGFFFLFIKLLSNITKQKGVDHTCHISKIIYNNKTGFYDVLLFEANFKDGIKYTLLSDKIKKFNTKIYLGIFDKKENIAKKKKFEAKHINKKYSIFKAIISGVDIFDDDMIKTKNNPETLFCSLTTALYLKDQGINISHIEKGNSKEMTPADLWDLNCKKKLLIKS